MPCLSHMTTGLQPWETSRAQSVVRLSARLATQLDPTSLHLHPAGRARTRQSAGACSGSRRVGRRCVEHLDRPVERITLDLTHAEALKLVGLHPGSRLR
jgi:hypothetical protein